MKLDNIFINYCTSWRFINSYLQAEKSLTRRVASVALAALSTLVFPINIVANILYDRFQHSRQLHLQKQRAEALAFQSNQNRLLEEARQQKIAQEIEQNRLIEEKRQQEIAQEIARLDISNPQLIELEQFEIDPLVTFQEIAMVNRYKLIGNCGETLSVRYGGLRFGALGMGLPQAEREKKISELTDKHLEFIEKCRLNGKGVIEHAVYDPEGMFELWQVNKEKIALLIEELEKVNFPLSDNQKNFFALFKDFAKQQEINRKDCYETMARFIATGSNMIHIAPNNKELGHIFKFFLSLGQAAYGDIHPDEADFINLPEKGVKEVLILRKEFPQHSLNTIRNLLSYFEHSSHRSDCVRSLLKKLQPYFSKSLDYVIKENTLRKGRGIYWDTRCQGSAV